MCKPTSPSSRDLSMFGSMFTYIALPDPSKQFRLISLQPSSTDTLINCSLVVHDIADSPRYYAISYHYGDPSAVDTILVNGQETQVNRNCWHALNQVRAQSRSGLFWVDAVCINQSDVKEKSCKSTELQRFLAAQKKCGRALGQLWVIATSYCISLQVFQRKILPSQPNILSLNGAMICSVVRFIG